VKYIKAFEQKTSTELIESIINGDLNKVDDLIKSGSVDVNKQSSDDETALIVASYQNRLNIVKDLINAGADVNIKSNYTGAWGGYTALMQASYHNFMNIVKELIDAGADVNIKNSDGHTALYYAMDQSYKGENYLLFKSLLNAGADYNLVDLFDFVSDVYREKLKIDFPEKYDEYLMIKNAKKYNI
jgi:ankyrin repeat protein